MGLFLNGADEGNALGTQLAGMLQQLNLHAQAGVRQFIANQERGTFADVLFPANDDTPDLYFANLQVGVTIVLIGGAVNSTIAQKFYAGYTPPFSAGFNGYNTWVKAKSDYVKSLLVGKGWWSVNGSFLCAGWSAGGGIAMLLADQNKSEFEVNRTAYHSFGAPRVTGRDPAVVGDRTPGVRWMLHNDPVPLLPLRFSDAPWIIPVVGITGALTAGQYVHWHGGWQLTPGIIGHPEEIPIDAAVSPVTSFLAWLFNNDTQGGNGHSITEYYAAMLQEQNLLTVPNRAPSSLAPTEQTESHVRRILNSTERAIAESISNAEHRQNAIPVVIPQGAVWQAVRIGRNWVVQFGNETVVIAGSKKAARGLARQMNDAFRRLQRSAIVDPASITTQLGGYFTAASDPAGGFQPVMNVTIPQ